MREPSVDKVGLANLKRSVRWPLTARGRRFVAHSADSQVTVPAQEWAGSYPAKESRAIRIFISYRSCDEPFAAFYIDEKLAERFGRDQVFCDNRTIRPGTHFPGQIWKALFQCQALVAVIGEQWLCEVDGRRLIDDPDDYVRREIAVALRRNILVVPVLVGDVSLPPVNLLPADIAGLVNRQYLHLRDRNARYDAMRLVDELVDLLGGARPLTP